MKFKIEAGESFRIIRFNALKRSPGPGRLSQLVHRDSRRDSRGRLKMRLRAGDQKKKKKTIAESRNERERADKRFLSGGTCFDQTADLFLQNSKIDPRLERYSMDVG